MSIAKTRIELHGEPSWLGGRPPRSDFLCVCGWACVAPSLLSSGGTQKALTETEKSFATLPVNVCGEFGGKGLTPVDQL